MIVDTRSGKVEGAERDGALVFKGIPYAAPPTGERRFRAPQPHDGWDGVRAALHFGHVAPQGAFNIERFLGGREVESSEDCLSLNVWTPAADDAGRPVMVWIHGGAYTSGSGAVPWYHGTTFARDGVVLVTINYRLGPFGFLHLADLAGEAFGGSGNAGILDQIAALEWVRDNIAGFGGDPHNVTVFGESAGAMSIGTLVGMPAARGLFQKAVLQSGASEFVHDASTATQIAEAIVEASGVGLDEFLALSTEKVQTAATGVEKLGAAQAQLPFRPVVDGVTLPRPPLDAVADGSVRDVPLIVGTTRDEWKLFALMDPRMQGLDEVGLVAHARRILGDHEHALAAVAAYRQRQPHAAPSEILSAMVTDQTFRLPAIRLVEAQLAAGGRAHQYLFTWATEAFGGALGSCHALEIPFVFDVLDGRGVSVLTGEHAPQPLADAMHGAWVAFAKTGDPGWPAYDPAARPTMVFDVESSVVDDPLGAERAAWEPAQ